MEEEIGSVRKLKDSNKSSHFEPRKFVRFIIREYLNSSWAQRHNDSSSWRETYRSYCTQFLNGHPPKNSHISQGDLNIFKTDALLETPKTSYLQKKINVANRLRIGTGTTTTILFYIIQPDPLISCCSADELCIPTNKIIINQKLFIPLTNAQ